MRHQDGHQLDNLIYEQRHTTRHAEPRARDSIDSESSGSFAERYARYMTPWLSGGSDAEDIKDRKRFARVFTGLIAIAIAMGAAALIFIVLMMVQSDYRGPNDEGFSLYKNSRFEECAARPAEGFNCTYAMDRYGLREETNGGNDTFWFGYLHWFDWGNEADNRNWCNVVGCLADYQVVPAVPVDDATDSSLLFLWFDVVHIAVVLLSVIKVQLTFEPHFQESCEKGRPRRWLTYIVGVIGTMLWWWIEVFRKIGSPHQAYNLSPLNWILTWRAAQAFHWHPVACYFVGMPKLKRGLWIALLVVAIVQFGVSIYIIRQALAAIARVPWFRLVESEFAMTPGAEARCSMAEIRDDETMFKRIPTVLPQRFLTIFDREDDNKILAFVFLTVATIPEMIGLVYSWFRSDKPAGFNGYGSKSTAKFSSVIRAIALFGLLIIISVRAFGASIFFLQYADREAGFTVNHDCMTVHVGISGWRYYLDVNSELRALRIIKGLLNIGF